MFWKQIFLNIILLLTVIGVVAVSLYPGVIHSWPKNKVKQSELSFEYG